VVERELAVAGIKYCVPELAQHPGEGVPDGIDAAKVMPARLHAVGTFVEPNSLLINRLAPIPGVLAYDAGRVIDVAGGREAPGN